MFCPLWCATTTEYPCQGHPSSQRSPAPDIYARRWGSSFLTNLELYLPFSHVWDELRGRRRLESSSSQAGRIPLRRLPRPLSSSLRLGVPEGWKRRRWRGRGGGEPPPEARAGGECTQGKWPHSRTSGPPSRPSVYLFTFAGSSNTSAFSELRSTGAALVRPGPQLLAPAHRSLTPPVGGGVSSEQQQTRQERKALWENEERPGHTPRVGAWLGVPVGEAGWWGAPSAPNPRSSLNLRRLLGLKASWEALCSHLSPFRLVRACWVGASSRGI